MLVVPSVTYFAYLVYAASDVLLASKLSKAASSCYSNAQIKVLNKSKYKFFSIEVKRFG